MSRIRGSLVTRVLIVPALAAALLTTHRLYSAGGQRSDLIAQAPRKPAKQQMSSQNGDDILPSLVELTSPLNEFWAALRAQVDNPLNMEELAFRKATLEKRAKALNVAEIRRALILEGWRDLFAMQDDVATIDRQVREALSNRLVTTLRGAMEKGPAATRMAAATETGELGVHVRTAGGNDALARVLAPDLVKLLADPDAAVRQAAARALGRINPEPQRSAAALDNLLRTGKPADRRAVAVALKNWLEALELLSQRRNEVVARSEDLARAAAVLVPVAARGLRDADPQVRRHCLDALGGLASLILKLPYPFFPPRFPPAGRKPTQKELALIEQERARLLEVRDLVLPVTRALAEQLPALVAAAEDADLATAIAAAGALEELTTTRQELARRAALFLPTAPKEDTAKLSEDPLGAGLKTAVPVLVKRLSHSEADARLAAIYVIETIGKDAMSAAEALIRSLDDQDSFVRWGAARALGEMAPAGAATAAPLLAKLVNDQRMDTRSAAVLTLTRYGPEAKAAAPALARALSQNDIGLRLLVMRALGAIGPGAKVAVPGLVKALTLPDAQLRAQAARTLGAIDPKSEEPAEALRKALDDPDIHVRRAAGEAVLSNP